MPNPLNVPITPPRVAFIDPRSGTVSREWYTLLPSLYQLVGGSDVTLDDLQKGPPSLTVDEINHSINKASENLRPSTESAIEQIAELRKQIEALAVQPQFDYGVITEDIKSLSSAPVTKTTNFTVADGETWLINNKSGSSCTVTLPSAIANTGRVLHFQNYQAQTLVSASSNVVPLAGGAATTAILQAVAGANATLVSDGTNWVMTQYDSNNALQLE